ncbi:MAG: branched-chain amino acid ABC transporter permease [Acidobacteria bacterium]|nr:branched-chain amino acid ABC transporter permease [Acidobacteriota bacterium]
MDALQALVTGLGVGSVYALVAFGVALVYAVSRTLNFAHGEILTVGVFVALTAAFAELPVWQAIALGIAGAALLGALLERAVFRPLRRAPESMSWLLGVLIFAAVLGSATDRVWGQRTYGSDALLGGALGANDIVRFADVVFPAIYLWLLATGLVLMVALDLLLRRTAFGRAVRAVAHDRRIAALMGVDVERTMLLAFALAAGLGGLAGILNSPLTFVSVQLGPMFTFKGLTAAVLGGLGSARGAFAGGLALGVVEQMASLAGVSAGYRDTIALGVLILALVLRPAGLAGRTVEARR